LPSFSSVISKQSQIDEKLKFGADWNYTKRKFISSNKLGYFNDRLNYTDSNSVLFSSNKIQAIILQSDNSYNHKIHSFNVGANYTRVQSTLNVKEALKDTSYIHQLSKLAIFGSYKISLLKSKFNSNIVFRKEFSNQTHIPVTGNVGTRYQITNRVSSKINFNKSYRQPTLADLYWNPGGNPNLKSENSFEIDGGLEYTYVKNNVSLNIEATYFNRHTTNWIIWLPTNNAYWSPKNIAEVYSRGTETKTELAYHYKEFKIKLGINTSYVLSTNQKSKNENDHSVGRQLMYTPRYTAQGSFMLLYKNFNLLVNSNYTGYRFTATDNTSWLTPYTIANVKFGYQYSFNTIHIEWFGSVNNLFNKNYTVVVNTPMPRQNFEIGMTINYHKNKTTNNK
jgi:iron complex outermembrane receptor protein